MIDIAFPITQDQVVTVAVTILYAILYSLGGYVKARKDHQEPFSGPKFVTTILVGFLVGVFEVLTGNTFSLSQDIVIGILTTTGAMYLLETYGKVIWSYIVGGLGKAKQTSS